MTGIFGDVAAALSDRYRIERELGTGGMATVYLAADLKHDRKVAIKVLKPELAAVLGAERFVVEIKTTASLQHPHILPLFDSGTANGLLYYVMPYIQGETIREKLNRETQFGVDDAVRIAREVADALDYAHRHGVIHRDIKPENILLHDGRAMVMDFGIALAVSAAAGGRLTETGLSLGTPHYMSPEQATADKDLTPRSDIYSLGSVLYEMLAGEPPHVGGSAQAVIMKIITDVARPVAELRRSVPPHVSAAVGKAIERLPADRFDSAKSFADALVNPSFATPSSVHGTAAPLRTRGVSPLLFVATAAVAVASLVGAVWGWRRSDASRVVTRVSVTLPDSQRLADAASFSRVAVSPDGRTIVYVGRGPSASVSRLWIRQLDQLRATPLAGTDGAANPTFSPDGRRIAFVTVTPRALRVIGVSGGPATVLTDSLVDLGGVSWGSDGYIYYDGHLAGDGLARVRETGGNPEVASTPDSIAGERFHLNPFALPNGRGVIFTIARAGGVPSYDVAALDTRTGKHTLLVRGAVGRYATSGHLLYITGEGAMMAAPFDAGGLRIVGDAVPVAQDVAVRALSGTDVAISRSGTLVYASGSSASTNQELVWVARDGKATAVDPQFSRTLVSRVRLSPDGRQAACVQADGSGTRSVWVKQLDRGPAAKVLDIAATPAWSPDGKLLISGNPSGLVVTPADGSRLPASVNVGQVAPAYPDWSSDGKWVVYNVGDDVYGMNIGKDSTSVPLIHGPAVERAPAISPDGKWIAYSSDESGRSEVYVRAFPDTKLSRRQVSVAGGVLPRWSHNGRELFFVDESLSLVAVPVTPGPAFVSGEPKRLFDAVAYGAPGFGFDVAGDGRFLMIRPVGAVVPRPDELILVENFVEELKTKVKK